MSNKRNKDKRGVWVLTRSVNDYNQQGDYFEAVFETKPTVKQLAEYFKGQQHGSGDVMGALAFIEHLLNGGGRTDKMEDTWFYLEFVAFR